MLFHNLGMYRLCLDKFCIYLILYDAHRVLYNFLFILSGQVMLLFT